MAARVIMGHCILVTHARRIDLASDYYRSFQDEEIEGTVIHLLETCSALYQRKYKHLLCLGWCLEHLVRDKNRSCQIE